MLGYSNGNKEGHRSGHREGAGQRRPAQLGAAARTRRRPRRGGCNGPGVGLIATLGLYPRPHVRHDLTTTLFFYKMHI